MWPTGEVESAAGSFSLPRCLVREWGRRRAPADPALSTWSLTLGEKESGGSGLRYSFVIRLGELKHEVGVDAKTGEVLENSIEGEHSD
jgi:hypothetical protein